MRIWIFRRFDAYGRFCLLAAIFLSSVIFAPGSRDTFNLVKLTALWTLGICAFAFWMTFCAERRMWPSPPRLLYPAAAFMLFASSSAALSASPTLSFLGQQYSRYGGVLSYLTYALIATLIYALYWEQPQLLNQIIVSTSAACLLVGAYVLIQAAGLDWHEWQDPGGGTPISPVSTFGNSNFVGGFLGTTLPFTIYLVASARSSRIRVALSGLLGLHLLALWYAQARGGMVGAVVGLVTLAFCYRERIPRWAKAAILSVLMLLSAVAVMAIWHPGSSRPPEAVSRLRQLDSFTLETRFWYWAAAARIFSDHPILGTGPDTYFAYYPQYRLPKDGQVMGLNLPDKPHNALLEHFSNEGALGGGAYVLLVGLALTYGYRRSRQLGGKERLLLVSLTAALAAYLGQSFFSIDVPGVAVMGWVCLGAIAAAADPAALAGRQGPVTAKEQLRREQVVGGAATSKRRSLLLAAYLALFAVAASLVALGARPLRADAAASAGRTDEALKLNPLEASYYITAGDEARSVATATRDPLLASRLFDRAERHYRKALDIQPGNIVFRMRVATLYSTRAHILDATQVVRARRIWRTILNTNPTDKDVRLAYASAKRAERRVIWQTQQAVAKDPQNPLAWVALGSLDLQLGKAKEAEKALRMASRLDPGNRTIEKLLKKAANS